MNWSAVGSGAGAPLRYSKSLAPIFFPLGKKPALIFAVVKKISPVFGSVWKFPLELVLPSNVIHWRTLAPGVWGKSPAVFVSRAKKTRLVSPEAARKTRFQ